jgi:4-hydroxy-tetrahydrodipicolinate reductase
MKICVLGAAGRTGSHIVRAIVEHPDAELSGALERPDHPLLGQDVGVIIGGTNATGLHVTSELGEVLAASDVAIDFSAPQGLADRAAQVAATSTSLVVGTTGVDEAGRAALASAGQQVPVVVAPNMSVGVNVVLQLLQQASKLLGPTFDFEIVEMHHRGKVDAPSGTALRMAEVVADERQVDLHVAGRHGRSGAAGPRSADEIGILALRGGDVVGEHTAIFAGLGERVEITHRAHGRETFARGALRAALWTADRAPGVYSMSDVLVGDEV